ncbi:MAG: hypothetical protein IPJ34_42535 [Myxococcales bacterium]|nr:hypothetical protein [Myxococcales bacterium]
MNPMSLFTSRLAIATVLATALPIAIVATTRSAHAEADDARLVLRIEGTLTGITAEELRAAIAAELGVEVALDAPGVTGRATVTVKIDGAQAKVTFSAGGRAVERPVKLPKAGNQALDVIVLIVGNLARDEAGELIAELHVKITVGGSASTAGSASGSVSASASAEVAVVPSAAPPPPVVKPVVAPKPAPVGPPKHCSWKGSVLGADFLPGVGSSTTEDGRHAVRVASFNAVGGVSHGLSGVEIGGVFNIETGFVCGVQIGGAVNVVGGDVSGVQIGGAVNVVSGNVAGVQVSGAFGLGNDFVGVQFAGGLALGRDLRGGQVGGGVALARDLEGVQFSGGFGLARNVKGVQVGSFVVANDLVGAQLGAVNAAVTLRGAQLGTVNFATQVYGAQLGAVNISTGRVAGLQLGVVNVADDVDVPIGVVNVVRKGHTTFDLWSHESGYIALGIVHGGRYVHNVFGVGMQPSFDGSSALPGLVYGLGLRAHHDARYTLDIDALVTTFLRVRSTLEKTTEFFTVMPELRAVITLPVFEHASIMFGPTVRVLVSTDPDTKPEGPWSGVRFHDGRSSTTYSTGTAIWMVPGAFVGIRI